MTLGEFREQTAGVPDHVEIVIEPGDPARIGYVSTRRGADHLATSAWRIK